VEKILVIHSSGSVYYHYYPYFLSKLTKEGKVPKLRLAAKPVRRERRFVCKKKKKLGTVATKPDANAARLLSCLQKERDADVASRPAFASCKRQALQASKTSSTVEKRLHIHSTRCAKAVFLLAGFLSTSVRLGYNAFPAHSLARKPLTL
jgi:hypothetical protein